jgi:hypothetical protein
VTGSLNFEGSLGISFQGEKTWIDLPVTSAELVQNVFENSQQFGEVTVAYSSSDTTISTHILTLTFLSWPTVSKENNLYSHEGNPPVTDFTCDTSLLDSSVSCEFVDSEASYLRGKSSLVSSLSSLISCRVRVLQQQRDL